MVYAGGRVNEMLVGTEVKVICVAKCRESEAECVGVLEDRGSYVIGTLAVRARGRGSAG